MKTFHASGLCGDLVYLERRSRDASLEPPDEWVDPNTTTVTRMHLQSAEYNSRIYSLVESESVARKLKDDFSYDMVTVKNKELHLGIEHLIDLIRSELKKQTVLYVPAGIAKYYQTPKAADPTLFGAEVDTAFPSARMDIVEAGKALACGLNNATVYHLMCVAEIGLRTLAWDRRVAPKHNKRSVPLEFAQWGELISNIEPKIDAIKKWPSKPLIAQAQQFYNAALVEARSFNNGWRTHAMHARGTLYKEDETVALFGHVQRFMQTLSTTISETTRTPLVWKKQKN